MGEGVRTRYEKAFDLNKQLISIIGSLEYFEKVAYLPNRAKLLRLAIDAIRIVEQDIYENELSGVARLEE